MTCRTCGARTAFDLSARLLLGAQVAWVRENGHKEQERAGTSGVANAVYKDFVHQKATKRSADA
jgi:hypothetical protein